MENSSVISSGSEAGVAGRCSDNWQIFVKAFSTLKRITSFGIGGYCSLTAMGKSVTGDFLFCLRSRRDPILRWTYLPPGPKWSAVQQK